MEKNNYSHKAEKVKIMNEVYEIANVEMDGIDHADSPDFCDAFIASAMIRKQNEEWREASEQELDAIMQDSSFVYDKVMEEIYWKKNQKTSKETLR